MMKERNTTNSAKEPSTIHRLRARIAAFHFANKTGVAALALLLGGSFTWPAAASGNDNRAPDVPDAIAVPGTTNKVHFHGFGVGVQIYTWDGVSWGRSVPDATLFDADGNVVAAHSAGPTWTSNSGSKVVGTVVLPTAIVDTNAIPWVLLQAVPTKTEGPGIFAGTTYIQRVNTTGGKAPSTDGAFVGQVAAVPYTADYFFFRRTN